MANFELRAAKAEDAEALAAIYRPAVLSGTASFEIDPPDAAEMGRRMAAVVDASYPYLQIYTPPGRDSIAVENLSGAPDCFNNKMGLHLLQPAHSQIFTVRYTVSVD